MPRLKIISDGTTRGTRIEDENGDLLYGVVRVVWEHTAGREPSLTLEVVGFDLELEAEPESILIL